MASKPESFNVATDTPSNVGVKEVEWSAFSASSMVDISHDFFTSLSMVQSDTTPTMNAARNSSYKQVQRGDTNIVESSDDFFTSLAEQGDCTEDTIPTMNAAENSSYKQVQRGDTNIVESSDDFFTSLAQQGDRTEGAILTMNAAENSSCNQQGMSGEQVLTSLAEQGDRPEVVQSDAILTMNAAENSSCNQVEYQGMSGEQVPEVEFDAISTMNAAENSSCNQERMNGEQGGDTDTNSVEYWDGLYPGWKYDPVTSQWYQCNVQGAFDANESTVISSEVLQTEFGAGTMQGSSEFQYPAHMYFDPTYPGWYYDTIAQQWRSLEATEGSGGIGNDHDTIAQQWQSLEATEGSRGVDNDHSSLATSSIDGMDPQFAMAGGSVANSTMVQSWQGSSGFDMYSNNQVSQLETTFQSNDGWNWGSELNSFSGSNSFPVSNHSQQVQQNGPPQYPTSNIYSNQQSAAAVFQPFFPNGHSVSSAGRPPHALVTFGFGGKLVVMKDSSSGFPALGSKNGDLCSLSVLNLMEVVKSSSDSFGTNAGGYSYFNSLCHQSFPGPLVGGNVGSKELYKWIDERILNCGSLELNRGNGQCLKLLLSLLKIACQHYGKLRSFGGETGSKEKDPPELAVANLFASAKRNVGQYNDYNASTKCLMPLPSEAQIQAIATEVQNLLISGKQIEALQRAQEGQLWGFALILAQLLGEQFYADTVKQMAESQLAIGSPLRSLCLLIARKPEEVFVNNLMPSGNVYGAVHMSQHPVQSAGCSMLENWEENLAVITANRTENDHLVITHLGDCLLKEKSDVIAAHICYLIADAGFEPYSESSRLCLIGADHWNFPRTYASPEAIQRTELFEYAKVLGNSQFFLLQLQPYKLIYAHMLAEVGRVADSLKYCQAINKSLRTGRSPEADSLKQYLASFEERIKTHQQTGYTVNLAPTKIVGRLLNFFGSTARRAVGGLPPSGPSTMQNTFQGNENKFQSPGLRGTDVQSTMGMSALTPSASMDPISQWALDKTKMTMQNRSISDPDIGRTSMPDQVNSSAEAATSTPVAKQTSSTRTSRFGPFNFGAQILQKTVGLVLKPWQGRQAKLGDTNKIYYDEKLKRWIEEGAEPPPEEAALPPPPMTTAFQNGNSEYYLTNALSNTIDGSPPGSLNSIPEIPSTAPTPNQFSARGRIGLQSRYVDTFTKGSTSVSMNPNTFQTPSVPSVKPASPSATNFFVPMAAPESAPAPARTNDETSSESRNEQRSEGGENSGTSMHMNLNEGFQNQIAPRMGTSQRFSSTGNIPSTHSSQSRRTSSWNTFQNPASIARAASPCSSFAPLPSYQMHLDRNPSGDGLQDVEV